MALTWTWKRLRSIAFIVCVASIIGPIVVTATADDYLEPLQDVLGPYAELEECWTVESDDMCAGVSVPMSGNNPYVMVVIYDRSADENEPTMQIQVEVEGAGGFLGTRWAAGGYIYCDLDAKQAAHLLTNGVPESLQQALIAVADEHGWRNGATLPPPGWIEIHVDADDHFVNAAEEA